MKQTLTGISAAFELRRISAFAQAAILASAALLPLLLSGSASAAQLTNRKVTIDDSVVSETGVGYDFEFDWAVATDVEGVLFEFCTAPLGTCTLPTGMNVNRTLSTLDAHTNFPNNATSFAEFATDNTGDCDDIDGTSDDTMYCITRTEATSAAGTNATVNLGGITNPSSIQTVYVRIALYDDAAFGSGDRIHEGVVAAAIVDQLTINGRVQERLDFCVAAVDDTDVLNTVATNVTTCSAISDANVDIGVIDDGATPSVSPVTTTATNGADDDYGILMVNTNASGGVVIGYYAEDVTSVASGDTDQLKSFRVVPTDCDATASVTTDQCFVSASNAGDGAVLTAGTELFGMYIPCVDQNDGVRSTTANLSTADDSYDGDDSSVTTVADCENETFTSGVAEVAWNTSGAADTLISSTAVVDDEIVKLRFAATASSTTPTGSYTVVTTYIATPTF
jgi:hypothetical protein